MQPRMFVQLAAKTAQVFAPDADTSHVKQTEKGKLGVSRGRKARGLTQ